MMKIILQIVLQYDFLFTNVQRLKKLVFGYDMFFTIKNYSWF
jgi:hypothetical protein